MQTDPAVYEILGRAHSALGRLDEAAQFFAASLTIQSARFWTTEAKIGHGFDVDEPGRGRRYLRDALLANKQTTGLIRDLAYLYADRGDMVRAQAEYHLFVRLCQRLTIRVCTSSWNRRPLRIYRLMSDERQNPSIRSVSILRSSEQTRDWLAVEEPLEIRVNGEFGGRIANARERSQYRYRLGFGFSCHRRCD